MREPIYATPEDYTAVRRSSVFIRQQYARLNAISISEAQSKIETRLKRKRGRKPC